MRKIRSFLTITTRNLGFRTLNRYVNTCVYGLLLCCLLTSCNTNSRQGRSDNARVIASQAGLRRFIMRVSSFDLVGFLRMGADKAEPVVYIEGDGFAWVDRYTPSSDPTPRNPLALKLAVIDRSPSVIYLARPYQFLGSKKGISRYQKYWTESRFSEEVIAMYDELLLRLKKEHGCEGFHLVGFSGGGAIAALLAERNESILSLRTISGNLDHEALNRAKDVSQLRGSLNPMDIAAKLKDMPQIHYVGKEDKVVPRWVAKSFVKAVGSGPIVKVSIIPRVKHLDGWERAWRGLYSEIPGKE